MMMMMTMVLEQLKAPVADENLYSRCFPKAPQSCLPTGPGGWRTLFSLFRLHLFRAVIDIIAIIILSTGWLMAVIWLSLSSS